MKRKSNNFFEILFLSIDHISNCKTVAPISWEILGQMCDAGTETAETETETAETAETADEVHYNTPLPFFQNGRGIIITRL